MLPAQPQLQKQLQQMLFRLARRQVNVMEFMMLRVLLEVPNFSCVALVLVIQSKREDHLQIV